jgi:hypothetical protein
MGLSSDPEKRAAQLANLRPGPLGPVGNQHARRHGVYARITEEELDAKTREIFDALSADAPVRDPDGGLPASDALAVRLLAECLVRRERADIEEIRHGVETKDGKLRGVVAYRLRLDQQAIELAIELGLTPKSRVALGLQLAQGLSAAERLDKHLRTNHDAGGDDGVIEGEAS